MALTGRRYKTIDMAAAMAAAVISVLSGSSWTTIATIGVAFMGIGSVWGYNPAWIAGAIISGAYFGDKVYQYKYGYEGGHERRGSMLMRIFHQIQICVFCGCKVINKTP